MVCTQMELLREKTSHTPFWCRWEAEHSLAGPLTT